MNLVEALQRENDKNREFLADLDRTAKLFHGENATVEDDAGLNMSAKATRVLINTTERAISSGDPVEMVRAAKMLGITGEDR